MIKFKNLITLTEKNDIRTSSNVRSFNLSVLSLRAGLLYLEKRFLELNPHSLDSISDYDILDIVAITIPKTGGSNPFPNVVLLTDIIMKELGIIYNKVMQHSLGDDSGIYRIEILYLSDLSLRYLVYSGELFGYKILIVRTIVRDYLYIRYWILNLTRFKFIPSTNTILLIPTKEPMVISLITLFMDHCVTRQAIIQKVDLITEVSLIIEIYFPYEDKENRFIFYGSKGKFDWIKVSPFRIAPLQLSEVKFHKTLTSIKKNYKSLSNYIDIINDSLHPKEKVIFDSIVTKIFFGEQPLYGFNIEYIVKGDNHICIMVTSLNIKNKTIPNLSFTYGGMTLLIILFFNCYLYNCNVSGFDNLCFRGSELSFTDISMGNNLLFKFNEYNRQGRGNTITQVNEFWISSTTPYQRMSDYTLLDVKKVYVWGDLNSLLFSTSTLKYTKVLSDKTTYTATKLMFCHVVGGGHYLGSSIYKSNITTLSDDDMYNCEIIKSIVNGTYILSLEFNNDYI